MNKKPETFEDMIKGIFKDVNFLEGDIERIIICMDKYCENKYFSETNKGKKELKEIKDSLNRIEKLKRYFKKDID